MAPVCGWFPFAVASGVIDSSVCFVLHRSFSRSGPVLFVADLFHPVDRLAVQRSWMAMCVIAVVGAAPCQCFSPGGNQTTSPGRISSIGPPSLRPAEPGGDDQGLAERMGVPGGARARLERDAGATRAPVRAPEQRVDADRAGELVGRALAGRLRAASFDLHNSAPLL